MNIITDVAKEAVEFQKTLFDDSFNLLVKYSDNVENIATSLIDRYGNVPEQVKGNIDDLTKKAKEGRNQIKKLVDDNFQNIEKVLAN